MRPFLILLAMTAPPALAQTEPFWPGVPLPAIYEVTSPTPIREAPNAVAPSLGTIPPGTIKEITRLSDDEAFGMVNSAHGYGWVEMSGLTRTDDDRALLERPLFCTGTEPFWDLHLTGTGEGVMTPFSANDPTPIPLTVTISGKTIADPMGTEIAELTGPDRRFLASFTYRYCIDSMSDAEWGIEILALEHRPGDPDHRPYPWSGCCALEAPAN